MKKRILSLALSLCLCLALTPAASATESLGFPAAFQGDGYYISATPTNFRTRAGLWALIKLPPIFMRG